MSIPWQTLVRCVGVTLMMLVAAESAFGDRTFVTVVFFRTGVLRAALPVQGVDCGRATDTLRTAVNVDFRSGGVRWGFDRRRGPDCSRVYETLTQRWTSR